MRTIAALSSLALATALPVLSAPRSDAFLIKANSVTVEGGRTVAAGDATIVIGETRLTADEIAYDAAGATLTLSGRVTIHSAEATIEAKEATINPQGKRVFMLSKGNIVVPGAEPFDAKVGSQQPQPFSAPFLPTETQLPRTLPNR
jgi:lipopolysaccharide assembly outer membrane protein LptD (OstA)